MKKILFLLSAIITLFACNSEEYENPQSTGLQVNAEFLKLSDDSTTIAGNLIIKADVPEVSIQWNTGTLCNLDTTQTTLKLSKGGATLPIKWMGKLGSGAYGPEGIAFKAGVQIIAGDKIQYVPLVWAEEIDSTKIKDSAIQTRAGGNIMPRVAQISMFPTTVNMNDQTGGAMRVNMTDISFAVLDVSEFIADMHVDLSKIPTYITESTTLDFKWTAAGAPNNGFSTRVVAISEGLSVYGIVNYETSGTGGQNGTLSFLNSNLPAGNIPYGGGTYTFNFDGTYTGAVQMRAMANGTVISTGAAVITKKPSVVVPGNTTTAYRSIAFQYKRDESGWIDMPATTNRVQDDAGTLTYENSNLPAGNLPRSGGTYMFNFSGTYTGGVQVRALANGVVNATGMAVVNKKPSVTVTANTAFAFRNITFQYKREDQAWTNLPATTNRVQGHPGEGIAVGGYTWAPGNLVRIGGEYKFYERQDQYSSVWNGGDYWLWNTLDPNLWQNANLSYSWNSAYDPCRQVTPAGTWRTPSSGELNALKNTGNYWGYSANNVAGRFFGPNRELFLPAAGYRPKTTSITGIGAIGFYWASSQVTPGGNVYMLAFDSTRSNVDYGAHRANGSQIRCIRNN